MTASFAVVRRAEQRLFKAYKRLAEAIQAVSESDDLQAVAQLEDAVVKTADALAALDELQTVNPWLASRRRKR